MTRSFELAKAEAAMIVVPSQATADDCVDHGVDTDRLAVVHWGADPAVVTEFCIEPTAERGFIVFTDPFLQGVSL